MVGAVIYVRVSTKEQTENLSLPTQLRACEEYCRRQGYEILERFHEEGESAKTTDRSQLQNLLTYCRLNKGRVHFVVVFNLTRFARDKYDHFALRSHLQSLGISLRSATEPIDDTSTGKLIEGVLAAFAQFDNDCRSDRTRAGMRAALELGRWVFLAPIGYLNAPRAMGKSLMPAPERAPIVRRVFEEYGTGRFTKQQVLEQARTWGLTNRRGRPLTSQAIGVLLRNKLYARIVDVPEYGVRAKRGDFEPLISEDLFYRVQSVLSGRVPSTTPQQRAHPEFPLREVVVVRKLRSGSTGMMRSQPSTFAASQLQRTSFRKLACQPSTFALRATVDILREKRELGADGLKLACHPKLAQRASEGWWTRTAPVGTVFKAGSGGSRRSSGRMNDRPKSTTGFNLPGLSPSNAPDGGAHASP
jgi:DNA invertase Pin-like site-specific DNA recombinase